MAQLAFWLDMLAAFIAGGLVGYAMRAMVLANHRHRL